MSIKLSSKLPADDNNGLAPLAKVIEENPLTGFTAVVRLVPSKRIEDYDKPEDPEVYELRIEQVEVVTGGAETRARILLDEEYSRRTGHARLTGIDGLGDPDDD
jgi:hypothetical protein